MNAVIYDGKTIDIDAARMLMDEELCEAIHGAVDNDQEFIDAYAEAHWSRYGTKFAV